MYRAWLLLSYCLWKCGTTNALRTTNMLKLMATLETKLKIHLRLLLITTQASLLTQRSLTCIVFLCTNIRISSPCTIITCMVSYSRHNLFNMTNRTFERTTLILYKLRQNSTTGSKVRIRWASYSSCMQRHSNVYSVVTYTNYIYYCSKDLCKEIWIGVIHNKWGRVQSFL